MCMIEHRREMVQNTKFEIFFIKLFWFILKMRLPLVTANETKVKANPMCSSENTETFCGRE